MKKFISALMCLIIISAATVSVMADELTLDAAAVILVEADTGTVLYEENADAAYPPASVTKVMTLLLIMEAIDGGKFGLEDTVQVSEYAASMGGSQVFLAPGEQMSVRDLLKSVVVASANDAATALAETVAGSEESFVARMNDRAAELGMLNTHFENPTGLDDDTENHVTSARDIALMSSELLRHPTILEYSGIWMDTIREGAFTLTNTNRLIRFYRGATGLKTGSTSKAHFCISATAMRDGMHLIAVVMGSPTRDVRNECAKKLLDYGFANHSYACRPEMQIEDMKLKLLGGVKNEITLTRDEFKAVLGRGEAAGISEEIIIPESIQAPVCKGDEVGEIIYTSSGKEVGRSAVRAAENAERITYLGILGRILQKTLLRG